MEVLVKFSSEELDPKSATTLGLIGGIALLLKKVGYAVTDIAHDPEKGLLVTTDGKLHNSILDTPVVGMVLQQVLQNVDSPDNKGGSDLP